MKKTFLIVLIAALAGATAVRADIWGVTYSGRLLNCRDGAWESVSGGGRQTNLTVRIYDESDGTATNVVWQRTLATRVLDGWFTVELEDLPETLATASGSFLTIGVTPENGDEIAPRQHFAAVPTAVCAADALGSNRGLSVTGELVAASLTAKNATFAVPVTHEASAVFRESQELSLKTAPSSGEGRGLSAHVLAVAGSAAIDTLKADRVESTNAARLAVSSIGVLAAKNFAATKASVVVNQLEGTNLTVRGDLTLNGTGIGRVKHLHLAPGHQFFKWDSTFTRLKPGQQPDSGIGYEGDGSTGRWVVQQDCFLSIAPLSSQEVRITVEPKVGETVTYVQSASGGKTDHQLQMFVQKGDVVSWTGAEKDPDSDGQPYLNYATFTY